MKTSFSVTIDDSRRVFQRELTALRLLRSSNQSRIINMLASFSHQGHDFIILPLAEADLRHFWAATEPASIEPAWCLQEMAGLTEALSHIHNSTLTLDLRPLHGFHMDLKPTNILIMKDEVSGHRSWNIGDFSLSCFYLKDTDKEISTISGPGTYEPPERQLELPQSQASDIWSLGCVFAECVSWLIRGSSAIDDFAEARMKDLQIPSSNFIDDHFFSLNFDSSWNPVGAVVRPAVKAWFRELENDPKCHGPIRRLLHLIEHKILVADPKQRLNAKELSVLLKLIADDAIKACQSLEPSGDVVNAQLSDRLPGLPLFFQMSESIDRDPQKAQTWRLQTNNQSPASD